MSGRASRLAAFGAASLYALSASAYQPSEAQWDPAQLPIPYRVNANSAPSSLGATAALAAVDAGLATWAAPTCTRWRSTNAGSTSATRASGSDRTNTFLWISGSWPAELGSVNVTIGVTTPVYIPGRYVIDADIQFNAVGFRWNTAGGSGFVDTQSIATHEEGHFLGLDHTPIRTAVMYASYSGGQTRDLHSDDVAGVCALYPSGGPVPDAGTATDPCARFTSCAGCTPNANCGWCAATSTCQTGISSGPTSGASCATANWRWDPRTCTTTTPTDSGATTDPCNASATCGACTPVNGCGWCGSLNRCVSGTPTGPVVGACTGWAWLPNQCTTTGVDAGSTGGTAAFGERCATRTDCASGGLCVGNTAGTAFCTRVCTDDCTCPRGYGCAGRLTSGQTVCIPGANGCVSTEPTDAGVAPADIVTPRDVVIGTDAITRTDVTTPADVVAPAQDLGASTTDAGTVKTGPDASGPDAGGFDIYAPASSGCGCRTAGAPSRGSAAIALLGLALATSRRRRRR